MAKYIYQVHPIHHSSSTVVPTEIQPPHAQAEPVSVKVLGEVLGILWRLPNVNLDRYVSPNV